MLIYSKEPLNVMMKNILLLDDPLTDGYVYVSKETYDQALSLNLTFNGDVGRVKGTISGKGMLNWANNKAVSHAVNLCAERFASPLNMLAPYLAYTVPMGIEWSDNDEEIAEMAYGVLHQMSQFVNFHATALMPAGAKADITIPKNIILSYKESWKAQVDSLDKCVVAVPVYVNTPAPVTEQVLPTPQPSNGVVTAFSAQAGKDAGVPDFVPTADEDISEDVVPRQATQETRVEEAVANDGEEEKIVTDAAQTEKSETDTESDKKEAGKEEADEKDADSDEESDEDDMEAKILAMMKDIENAPSDRFVSKSKEADTPASVAKEEPKEETVNVGESGSLNMTESQIAEGNRRILADYDI